MTLINKFESGWYFANDFNFHHTFGLTNESTFTFMHILGYNLGLLYFKITNFYIMAQYILIISKNLKEVISLIVRFCMPRKYIKFDIVNFKNTFS